MDFFFSFILSKSSLGACLWSLLMFTHIQFRDQMHQMSLPEKNTVRKSGIVRSEITERHLILLAFDSVEGPSLYISALPN